MFEKEAAQTAQALHQFQEAAAFNPGSLIVIGCSSSEIVGSRIGSATSKEAAQAVLPEIIAWAQKNTLHIAVQCCEHLNRCLIVEEPCAEKFRLEPVSVIPYTKAGGGLADAAMKLFTRPVVVESLRHGAHGGMDIGGTLIGMHLRRVAVRTQIDVKRIGAASVICAHTRPILIGGERAKYN